MKNKLTTLTLVLICICTFCVVKAKTNSDLLLGKVIYLDPGHGGFDPGAVYKEIKEADINLEIAKRVQDVLEQSGAIVYLTRYGDYDLSIPNTINRKRSDLSRRGNIINRSNCDLYLSIHLNADISNTWRGAQTFYVEKNSQNKMIAEIFQKQFQKKLNTKRKSKRKNDLYLNKRIDRPGILIEAGFITNANERYMLKQINYQKKIASAILDATTEYFRDF